MNALFRHLTVRLWLTALAGGAFSLTVLPWWQQIFGLHWLALPAGVILAVTFGITGWAMNRIGVALALRQVKEATVWERAGMIREAETAFQRSTAFFDSFWLSPFSRRDKTRWLCGTLAKFYLSQFEGSPNSRALVAGYLKHYPHDEDVAEIWLEGLASREHCSDLEYEAVARVGQALGHHKPIARLLMHVYLAGGRIDFDALQTYRRVWKEQQPPATQQLHALARLLRRESIINPWALQVYLKAYETGETDAIEGIAAGLRLLPISDESRTDLAAAQKLLTGLDAEKIHRLAADFKSEEADSAQTAPERDDLLWVPPAPGAARVAGSLLNAGLSRLQRPFAVGHKEHTVLKRRGVLYALCAGGIACLVIIAKVMLGPQAPVPPGELEREPAALQTVEEKSVEVDPFTIQVAAYLKSGDAQRLVDQLTRQKLDAFWTEAASANRTWYQVKVSHFPTRQAAQKFGQDLKSRGLIDDFYVANYEAR